MGASNGDAYRSFFSESTCCGFMSELLAFADIRWSDALDPLGVDDFIGMFNEYRGTISGGIDSSGITQQGARPDAELIRGGYPQGDSGHESGRERCHASRGELRAVGQARRGEVREAVLRGAISLSTP